MIKKKCMNVRLVEVSEKQHIKLKNEWDPTQKGCSGDMTCTYL